MTTLSQTIEERLARLEGIVEHLATKADLAELKAELHKGLNRNLYMTIAAIGIAVAVIKYLP